MEWPGDLDQTIRCEQVPLDPTLWFTLVMQSPPTLNDQPYQRPLLALTFYIHTVCSVTDKCLGVG